MKYTYEISNMRSSLTFKGVFLYRAKSRKITKKTAKTKAKTTV